MSRPDVIAFFLPQFHVIPENDEWWGEGFTEWTNTRRARPLFEGHEQPKEPADGDFFDLTRPGELARQSQTAKDTGLAAFCIYMYAFDDRRLLEAPLDAYAADSSLLPFCVSWANENWTRRWDGKDSQVLMGQSYGPTHPDDVYDQLRKYLSAPHYFTAQGRHVVVVHRVSHLPRPRELAQRWRERAAADGKQLHLVAAETDRGLNPHEFGFDAVAEFPPVGWNTAAVALRRPPADLDPSFRGRLLDYDRLRRAVLGRRAARFPRHRGVMPAWDNTARRREAATIYVGARPAAYRQWLAQAILDEAAAGDRPPLVFLNSWNEWAEGAQIQADNWHGSQHLGCTAEAIAAPHRWAHVDAGRPDVRVAQHSAHSLKVLARSAAGSAAPVRRALTQVSRAVSERQRGV